jgi:hypothetical protein
MPLYALQRGTCGAPECVAYDKKNNREVVWIMLAIPLGVALIFGVFELFS